MKSDTPEAIALIVAIKAAVAYAAKELAPKMDAAGITDPEKRMENVLQNVLRGCIETCLQQAVPYTEELPVGLALRLASYCLSSLPTDIQEHAATFVAYNLPTTHRDRVAQGIGLRTDWAVIAEGTETKQ